ncbi:hypothetical protein DQ384_06585 [Sphaerisporangium album]|uniref:Uncharacterized protein n=2 Tax=Sphaerisporangium album TaxID=509200 RepID=A0A367FQH8_9ACTN|nr:hypothetical protein DQ384_06585 [Sphaerisporangium album]
MLDEGQTRFAAAEQVAESFGLFACRRHMGGRCRLAVWALVVTAFAAGLVMPISAKAETRTAMPPPADRVSCAEMVAHKLIPCHSPQPSPRR